MEGLSRNHSGSDSAENGAEQMARYFALWAFQSLEIEMADEARPYAATLLLDSLRDCKKRRALFQRMSTDETQEVLAPYIESGLVDYTFFPGQKKQLAAYDDCFERHRLEARWIAVIDLDEFIVPIKDRNIPEFLHRMEHFSVVEINWLVYGSGGAKTKKPGGVMERFRCHSLPEHRLNTHVKSIADPRRVCTMTGCHEAARLSGRAADSHGMPLKKGFRDRKPQQDVIRINHYAVKSYEEFLAKRARGRARINTLRDMSYFGSYDLNDIEE